jgi:hypothetical protein
MRAHATVEPAQTRWCAASGIIAGAVFRHMADAHAAIGASIWSNGSPADTLAQRQ